MERQGYTVPRGHGSRGDLDTDFYESQFKLPSHSNLIQPHRAARQPPF